MAKKSNSKSKSKSTRSVNFVDLAAFIALVIAAILFLVTAILNIFKVNLPGNILGILTLVKDISVGIALGVGTWSFGKSRGKGWKTLAIFAIVVYIVCMIFGSSLIKF